MYYWSEITWDSFTAKSSTPRAHRGIGNDIRIMRRLMLPQTMGDVASKWTGVSHASPTNSQHAISRPNSLEVAVGWLHTVDTNTVILGVIKVRLVCVVAPPSTSFHPGPSAQGILLSAIQVMGSKYLTIFKNAKFDEVDTKIHGASIIHKRIKWLFGDPNPLWKKEED